MSPLQLRNWLRWCKVTFLVMSVVGVARVAFVAWTSRPKTVTYTRVPTLPSELSTEPSAATPRVAGGIPQRVLEQLMRAPTPLPSELLAEDLAPSVASSTTPKKPNVTRIYLAIHEGPPRTEVRMNGITLGHTPFVGEITCRHGEPLEFVLIPPKGVPRRSQHICDRTEITLTLDEH